MTDDTIRFPSFPSMRAAHAELVDRHRQAGDSPEIITAIADFLRLGQAAGALLDSADDRKAAQTLLNYWTTILYRAGEEPPESTLADFDISLAPELPDSLCPYVGLDAFRESNEGLFFGRAQLVAELVDRLRPKAAPVSGTGAASEGRLLAVLGASGSGKSSVARAGVLGALERGGLPGSADWYYFPTLVPGSNPLLNLARLTDPAEAEKTAEAYRSDGGHLAKVVKERFSGKVVLVVDQLEEAFTLCHDESIRQAFINNLLGLVDAGHIVIVTMRADFESQVARVPEFQARFEAAAARITPMGAKELREAIEEPAKKIGLRFESGVVEALLHDVLGEEAALPLLQFTLLKLWERRERNRVTWEAYRKLGGGRQALARAADEFFDGLIHEEQVTAKRLLLKMVRPGEGLEVTSNRVRRVDLYTKAEASDRIERVLEKFLRARLLKLTKGDTEEDDQIEVAHEALVRNWPRLVAWLDEERAALRLRLRLTAAAEQWLRLGKDPSALRRGALLQESLQFDDLSPLEEEYVKASRETEEAEQHAKEEARQRELEAAQKLAEEQRRRAEEQARAASRLRRLVFYLAGLSIVAIALSVFAGLAQTQAINESATNAALAATNRAIASTAEAASLLAQDEARNSAAAQATAEAERQEAEQLARRIRAGQLAAAAEAVQETNPQLGLLLGVEALNVTLQQSEPRVPAAEEALRLALASTGGGALRGHSRPVTAVAISASGRWVVTGSEDATARLWDLASNSPPTVLAGHTDVISAVAISPDEQWVITASRDGTARLWGLTASDPSASPLVLSDHQDPIVAVAFTSDARRFVTADQKGNLFLRDLATSDPTTSPLVLNGHEGYINDLAISADDHWLASASDDFTARLWDLTASDPTASPLVLNGHEGAVYSVAFSPDNHWLVSGAADAKVRLWDLAALDPAGAPVVLTDHNSAVNNVAISPDGSWLATTGSYDYNTGLNDSKVRLWNLAVIAADAGISDAGISPAARLGIGDPFSVTSVGFTDRWLVVASSEGVVHLWDVLYAGLDSASIQLRGHEGSIIAMAFSLDSSLPWLVTGSIDNTARLWSLEDFSASVDPLVLSGHFSAIPFRSLSISPDGHWLATGSEDFTARLWDLTAPNPARSSVELKHDSGINVVTISPDSHWLATGSEGAIWLWDLMAEDPSASPIVLRGHTGPVSALAFSPDSRWLVSSSAAILDGGGRDYTVRIWDVAAADPSASPIVLSSHEGAVYALAISPDGRWLFTGSEDKFGFLWDLPAITESPDSPAAPSFALAEHQDAIFTAAFSHDGRWLFTGDKGGGLFRWDMTAGDPAESALELVGHTGWVNTIAISPDNHWAATGSDDYTARLWDLTASDPSAASIILPGHTYNVNEVAFSPDNQWLATASADSTVRLWDLMAEDPAASSITLFGHYDQVTDVAISPDGRWLGAASLDATARLWTLPLDKLIELACATTGRNLTQTEWDQYFSRYQKLAYRQTCPEWPVHSTVVDAIIAEADTEARNGDIDGAIALYKKALEFDPSRNIDPETTAKQFAALGVMDRAYNLALSGDVEEATALYEQALELDPTLNLNPEAEARRTAAQGLSDRAYNLALSGGVEEATALYERALELDPTLNLNPEADARRIAAQGFYDRGYNLALNGDVEGAEGLFQRALELDPTFSISPESEALRIAAHALRDKADALANAGEHEEASIIFEQAVQGALLNKDPFLSATVCYYGSVGGHAAIVLQSCNDALDLDSESTAAFDARALARALTGDAEGAIEDYDRVIKDLESGAFVPFDAEQVLAEREAFREALEEGTDPPAIFDGDTLKKLREEILYLFAQG